MTLTSDSLGMGGGVSRYDTIHGRTEGGLFHGALRYPSPFFDIGHTYLPTSVQQMFRWCRYYFLVNPLINAVAYKMAEYPITQLIFDEDNTIIRDKWIDVAENKLKLRSFLVEVGLDYYCYGNAFVSVHFPFQKYLICSNCKNEIPIQKANYKFRNLKYILACDKCNTTNIEAKVKDHNYQSLRGIRLLRWNPEYVRVEHNDITGETEYFLELPQSIKNDILMGKKHIIEKTPHVFVEALRRSKTIHFNADNIYHLKRPTIAQKDMGWGMPLILPVLKDTYYLQILRKAQEAIAQQHIVPLRILFPQGGSNTSDPYSTTDLGLWRKRIEAEISKWRSDPNYIPILPLPIGNEVIGGEGRALMLHQEMRAWSEQIVAGMHVPIEFIFGGLQYSGSNVSMRMLENQFLGYRTNLEILVRDFVLGRIADYMHWARPKCHMSRFKMADDLQRSALVFQLNQAQKVSDTTLLNELDFDIVQEEKFKKSELDKQIGGQRKMQLANATIQGELSVIQAKYQALATKAMQEQGIDPGMAAQSSPTGVPGQTKETAGQSAGTALGSEGGQQQPLQGEQIAPGVPDEVSAYPENAQKVPSEGIPTEMQSPLNSSMRDGGLNLLYIARRTATYLEKLDEATRQMELSSMRAVNPDLHGLVQQLLQSSKGTQESSLNPFQQPQPEQRPPRRQNSII
jgi:hypothetical protein